MEPNPDAERLSSVDPHPASALAAPIRRAVDDISPRSVRRTGPAPFADFYRSNVREIRRALEVTLGDAELAEDAANEAMARALQRWATVSRYDNPEGWVYRVGLNWATSWLRRRRRERDRPMPVTTAAPPSPPVDHELRAAISNLSIEHRTVIVCRYLMDWSVARTAHAIGIPEGTVKSRLARALDNIRTELEET